METEILQDNIITRKEAQEKGLTQYFTGKPCKRGHVSPRNTQSCNCLECWREDAKVVRSQYPNEFKAKRKEEYHRNREKYLSYWKNKREENWDDIYQARKTDLNYRAYMQDYFKEYFKSDVPKAKLLARTRARKLKQKHATPQWADFDKIQQIYIECSLKTKETGIIHHVDHIVPINGNNVCGLHWEKNLRIITGSENILKSNSLDESLLGC